MTRIAKLYAAIAANPRGQIAFKDFERLLAAFGFRLDRTRGSHRHYVHPIVPHPLTIQPLGKAAKPYQVQELLDMIEDYGLSIDRE